MSTTTFGLSYLNEQQRFRRTPVREAVLPRPVAIDFKNITDVTRPIFSDLLTNPNCSTQDLAVADNTTRQELADQYEVEQKVISEQFEEPAEQKHTKLVRFLPVGIGVIALLSGLAVLGLSLHQNHQAAAQVVAITKKVESAASTSGASSSEAPPSETPVTAKAITKYAVAPDMPRVITIKKLNVYARILQMGILSSGALATPRNTYDTGWYSGSSKPGDGGTALIVGHVLGASGTGIFYNLKKLTPGDVITIERGDGSTLDYKVINKEQVAADKVDMNKLLLPITQGKAGLNLMTCGGTFQPGTETFTDRVIIYTERV